MALIFTEEQKLLQQTVRDFAENEIRPRIKEIETSHDKFIPRDLYKRMGELGFFKTYVPKEYGGLGLGATEACIITEELSKVSPTFGLVLMCVMPGAMFLTTNEHTQKYLEPVMNGDMVMNGGVTAPEGHTNVSEWSILARRKDNGWALNGGHLFNTNNTAVDLHKAVGLCDDGKMRAFLFEGTAEGYEHSTPEFKFGMVSSGGTSTYKDLWVPDELTFPYSVGTSFFYYNLYVICPMIALGGAEGLLAETIDWCKTRTKNFQPLNKMQAVGQKLAKLYTQLTVCRTEIYDACALLDNVDTRDEGCLKAQMSKAYVPAVSVEVCRECIKLFGGLGYHDVTKFHYLADALAAGIMDLPTDYHYEGVAKLLGIME